MKSRILLGSVLVALGVCCVSVVHAGELLMHEGDTLIYLGARTTRFSDGYPNGFMNHVKDGLARSGIKTDYLRPMPSYELTTNMVLIDKTLEDKHPQWLLFFGASEDILRTYFKDDAPNKEGYQKLIRESLDRYLATDTKVMLITCPSVGDNPESVDNKKVAECNAFLRALAVEKGVPLADPYDEMMALYKTKDWFDARRTFTVQHAMSRVVARAILRAVGVPEETLAEYYAEWKSWPISTTIRVEFTVDQYRELEKMYKEKGYPHVGALVVGHTKKAAFGEK